MKLPLLAGCLVLGVVLLAGAELFPKPEPAKVFADMKVYAGAGHPWRVAQEEFGVTATEVTATLLSHWHFPADLVCAGREHHDPLASDASNPGACVLNLACGVTTRFGLDLPGEAGHWVRTATKLTMAGVTEETLELCTENARAHYEALCATRH